MSFSWWVSDKRGKCLLDKYGINSQMFGLGPSGWPDDTPCPSTINDLRDQWISFSYKDSFEGAARDAVGTIQAMARENLKSLKPRHECPACQCQSVAPKGWSVDDINSLLAIDLDEVWRAGGGW